MANTASNYPIKITCIQIPEQSAKHREIPMSVVNISADGMVVMMRLGAHVEKISIYNLGYL